MAGFTLRGLGGKLVFMQGVMAVNGTLSRLKFVLVFGKLLARPLCHLLIMLVHATTESLVGRSSLFSSESGGYALFFYIQLAN